MHSLQTKVFANAVGQKIATVGLHLIEWSKAVAENTLDNPTLAAENMADIAAEVQRELMSIKLELVKDASSRPQPTELNLSLFTGDSVVAFNDQKGA